MRNKRSCDLETNVLVLDHSSLVCESLALGFEIFAKRLGLALEIFYQDRGSVWVSFSTRVTITVYFPHNYFQ